jgi:hypothetical protein
MSKNKISISLLALLLMVLSINIGAIYAKPPTDVEPPRMYIIYPPANGAVEGIITMKVNAWDTLNDVLFVKCDIDAINYHKIDYSAPYTFVWDTRTVPNKEYFIRFTASDNAGLNGGIDNNIITRTIKVTVDNGGSPPTVKITSPKNGATVQKKIWIRATATDTAGIKQVEFYINGKLVNIDKTGPYEWLWNTFQYQNQQYFIKARAVDISGNVAVHIIKITVNNPDNIDPRVKITYPSADAVFDPGVKINVRINYWDNKQMVKVEFYFDGSLQETKTDNLGTIGNVWFKLLLPYKNGTHVIKAIGYDAAGNKDFAQVRIFIVG